MQNMARLWLRHLIKAKICYTNIYTVGPRYMRGIGTPKIDLHIMNSHIKRPRMTDN